MTALRFELTFKTDELKKLDLPVEIRKPNMVLVRRALASEEVEVEPGTYYVGIRLPAGQESWSEVKVSAGGGRETIRLGPEPGDEPASESAELPHYFTPAYVPPRYEGATITELFSLGGVGAGVGGFFGYMLMGSESWVLVAATVGAVLVGAALLPVLASKVARPGYASYQRYMREARLRKFRGDALPGGYKADDEWLSQKRAANETDDLIEVNIEGENRGQVIQLIQTGEPAVNVVLPAWREHGCRVTLKKQPDARYSLEVHLHNTEAELLLRYWEQGRWQLAEGVTDSAAVSAQALLSGKSRHPIAASVGAYALLRLGALERLQDWSENLMSWFEWLPDGAAVRGEHLARMGEHREALGAFCALRERGLPYFSDGLSYAVDRLRLYHGLGEKYFDAGELKACADTLALLEPFCPFTDFNKPLTTFTGLDPSKPGAEPVGGKLASYGGLDVNELARPPHAEKGKAEEKEPPRPAVGAGA